jgi:hypothetical protein
LVLLPITSGAGLVVYRREMIEALEGILSRRGVPKQAIALDLHPVRSAEDFAGLRRHLEQL